MGAHGTHELRYYFGSLARFEERSAIFSEHWEGHAFGSCCFAKTMGPGMNMENMHQEDTGKSEHRSVHQRFIGSELLDVCWGNLSNGKGTARMCVAALSSRLVLSSRTLGGIPFDGSYNPWELSVCLSFILFFPFTYALLHSSFGGFALHHHFQFHVIGIIT